MELELRGNLYYIRLMLIYNYINIGKCIPIYYKEYISMVKCFGFYTVTEGQRISSFFIIVNIWLMEPYSREAFGKLNSPGLKVVKFDNLVKEPDLSCR